MLSNCIQARGKRFEIESISNNLCKAFECDCESTIVCCLVFALGWVILPVSNTKKYNIVLVF